MLPPAEYSPLEEAEMVVRMALQFILGNSGSGKSHFLYQHIIEEALCHPDINYLVVVPEQFTMQTQRDLVSMHPHKGIMNIDVLSFGRLAYRIFEEVGGDDRTILEDEGKSLVLRKIAGDYEKELKVLGRNLKKPGYLSEIKSVISEFAQYGLDPEGLELVTEGLNEESYLFWKLRDIQTIYKGFQEYLEERYITKEEILDVLRQAADRSELLKHAVVALDGFTGFTPVQKKLLEKLMRLCMDVQITVEMDGRENPLVYETPYQLFALSKEMVTSLTRIAREARVEIKEAVCLYERPVVRFRENPAMAFLEKELFRYSRAVYTEDQDAIRISCSRTVKQEVSYAAEQIRHLVRTQGYRYKEIAVITADLGMYAEEVQRVFVQYQIPVFVDHKRSILLNSFVEYLRSVLMLAEQNFSYDSVFRYLRSGHTGFEMEEVDVLENYVIASGIRGRKKWQESWIRRTKETTEEDLAFLNGLRVRLLEQTEELFAVLKKRKKTVEEITKALYEFLVREKAQEQLMAAEERFQEEGKLAQAKEYAQIYRIVIQLFDKFVELLGEEAVSLKEYCELLDAGLAEARVGVIPPSLDQGVVGDMERSRLKQIKILFLLGVNDTLIPGNGGAGGFLSERDREVLSEHRVALAPGAKEQNYIQKFYLYMNLTRPSERLYLSYAKSSEDGNALRPAYLIQDFKKLFPELIVTETEGLGTEQREFSEEAGFEALLEGLRKREKGLTDVWKELYSWYFGRENWRERVKNAVKMAFYRKEPQWIPENAARQLYQEQKTASVTRLEKFAACAYAHFLSYGLRLKEREEYQFESLDLGNIVHRALELFSEKLAAQKRDWTDVEKEERAYLVQECVEEGIAGYGNTVIYSTARDSYMETRIRRLVERTVWALTKQLEHGSFRPSEYELNFGSGKIDRIDTCETEDAVYVKVLDYKTGSKEFDLTSLYHGLQMQLVVYMKAALEYEGHKNPGKEAVPAGIFYYRVNDPFVRGRMNREEAERSLLKELKLNGVVNEDEQVIELLDEHLEKESDVIPVVRNKDGSLSKKSKAVRTEDFAVMMEYVQHMADRMEREMRRGNAQIAPYELGNDTGCDYCEYRDICGFDEHLEGFGYRRLAAYKKEEILERMQKEV